MSIWIDTDLLGSMIFLGVLVTVILAIVIVRDK